MKSEPFISSIHFISFPIVILVRIRARDKYCDVQKNIHE